MFTAYGLDLVDRIWFVYIVMALTRPKLLMIRFMTGILSMYRVIRSIPHPSAAKFQVLPRIITSTFNFCLKASSIYYAAAAPI